MSKWEVKTIIVGYDGSDGAERAIELAREVAQTWKATIVVLSAFPHQSGVVVATDDKITREIDEASAKVESAVARLRAAGVSTVPDVAQGPAAHALLEAAENRGADLIIVGCGGHHRLEKLLGSTCEDVVRHATVPVLIAR